MFRTLARTIRRLIIPVSRPVALLLAWTQRYTVALWWRSVRDEARDQLERRTLDTGRWQRLLSSLWRVSSDAGLANAPELRRIALDGERVTVDASETWHSRFLLDTRLGLAPVETDGTPASSVDRPAPESDPFADPSAHLGVR